MDNAIRYALLIGILLALAPRSAAAQWVPHPAPYPYPMAIGDFRASVRIEVSPKQAEVYVDGYYAGIVDDFDGTFQRLRLPAGPHEIVVRHDGFHSFRESAYLSPDSVYRIKRQLDPLAAGEPEDPRPPAGTGAGSYGRPVGTPQAGEAAITGSLVIRVQPDQTEIFIDGERWEGPEDDERLVVQLPEGPHRVDVRKPGFDEFSTTVEIRRGETVPLNVALSRP